MNAATQTAEQVKNGNALTKCKARCRMMRSENANRRGPMSGTLAAKCIESKCPIAVLVTTNRAGRSSSN